MFDLRVLDTCYEFAIEVYRISDKFPNNEIYGLTSQMRRAVASVGSNISEGKARGGDKEFLRFLKISRGSLEELRFQLAIAKGLAYVSDEEYHKLLERLNQTGGALGNLIKAIEKSL